MSHWWESRSAYGVILKKKTPESLFKTHSMELDFFIKEKRMIKGGMYFMFNYFDEMPEIVMFSYKNPSLFIFLYSSHLFN